MQGIIIQKFNRAVHVTCSELFSQALFAGVPDNNTFAIELKVNEGDKS